MGVGRSDLPQTGAAPVDFSVGCVLGQPPPSVLPPVPSRALVILSEAWAQGPLNRVGALETSVNDLNEPKGKRQEWSVEVLQAQALQPMVASPTSLNRSLLPCQYMGKGRACPSLWAGERVQ